MRTRIQKWGNSLALRIPNSLAHEIGLEQDLPVNISLIDGKLVIEPVQEPEITLDQLLSQVTEENLHHEVDTSLSLPKEIFPSSYECYCGHQLHFSENTIKEAKARSFKKRILLSDSATDEHRVVFSQGRMVDIICPVTEK